MVYRDRSFCSHSDECDNQECSRWVDFGVDTRGLPISLSDYKTDTCGYIPVEDGDER